MAALQWGNVAEWVGAVGTVGALIAAVLLLRKELRSLEAARIVQADERRARAEEREARTEERELRRREHARTVAVWLEDRSFFVAEGVPEGNETRIHVKNASSWPVDNCVAYLIHPIGGPIDDPHHPDNLPALELVIGTLPPGETMTETVDQACIDRERVIFPGLVAEVAFTDSAGIHWRRLVDGTLEEQAHMPRMC